jgi:hypothetical protein
MTTHVFTLPPSSSVEVVGGGNVLTVLELGREGLSAYQVAVEHGFIGTEAQWLASLKAVAYEHQQLSASASWTINHNFSRYPAVSLYTTGGAEMIGLVMNITTNQCIAYFDTPIAGYAIVT